MPLPIHCQVCGVTRMVPPSRYARGNKFCSMKCGGVGRRRYTENKKCTICKLTFPNTSEFFYSNRSKWDGRTTECKKCCSGTRKNDTTLKREYVIAGGCRCASCGMQKKELPGFFEIDHIEPAWFRRYRGGFTSRQSHFASEDMSNLQILCPNCHKLKTIEDNKRIREFKAKEGNGRNTT